MKILLLTFDEHEEKAIDKILATISDCVSLEAAQTIPVPSSGMSFPGLEIRQRQHRVIQGGEDVNLTRLEYSTLVFLASNPGIVLTQEQIFETVWNMDSDSCHSSVVNVIYNLRKKIKPDSKNPTYIKTVLGIGYKFSKTVFFLPFSFVFLSKYFCHLILCVRKCYLICALKPVHVPQNLNCHNPEYNHQFHGCFLLP